MYRSCPRPASTTLPAHLQDRSHESFGTRHHIVRRCRPQNPTFGRVSAHSSHPPHGPLSPTRVSGGCPPRRTAPVTLCLSDIGHRATSCVIADSNGRQRAGGIGTGRVFPRPPVGVAAASTTGSAVETICFPAAAALFKGGAPVPTSSPLPHILLLLLVIFVFFVRVNPGCSVHVWVVSSDIEAYCFPAIRPGLVGSREGVPYKLPQRGPSSPGFIPLLVCDACKKTARKKTARKNCMENERCEPDLIGLPVSDSQPSTSRAHVERHRRHPTPEHRGTGSIAEILHDVLSQDTTGFPTFLDRPRASTTRTLSESFRSSPPSPAFTGGTPLPTSRQNSRS